MVSVMIDRRAGLSSATAMKGPCRVATTANISLAGLQTIDGVTLVAGNRVLVKDQTTTSQNGVYIADTGNWKRAKDFNRNDDVVKGTRVAITDGTVNANSTWQVTSDDPIDIGTTEIELTQVERLVASDISGLDDATLPLAGSELMQVVQLSSNKKVSVNNLLKRLATVAMASTGLLTTIGVDPSGGIVRGRPVFVNAADNGVVADGVTDNLAKINSLVTSIATGNGGTLFFPGSTSNYYVSGPIQLKSRVTLLGAAREGGTVFTRDGDYAVFASIGVSILNDPTGAGHIRRWQLRDLSVEGGDYEAPLLICKATSLTELHNVRLSGSLQQLVLAFEWFDSRCYNCRFTHADDDTGTYYAVELRSGTDGTTTWEFTNQIHFYSCVWEDNIGKSLSCRSFITNEIYLENCKVENLACNLSGQLHFQSVANIVLWNLQVSTKGTAGHTIDDVLSITSASLVKAYITWEHQGTVAIHAEVDASVSSASPTAASVVRFASLSNCRPCNIEAILAGNTMDKLQDTKAVHRSGDTNQSNVWATGWTNLKLKQATNDGAQNVTYEKLHVDGPSTLNGIRFRSRNTAVNNNQWFEMGRLNADGGGNAQFRFMFWDGSADHRIWQVTSDRDFTFMSGMRYAVDDMAATGTTQGTGAAISAFLRSIFCNSADASNYALVLPAASSGGKPIKVYNATSTVLKVFAPTGISLNGVTNGSATVAANGVVEFEMGPPDATGWRTSRSVQQKAGWGDPSGTLSRAAYAAYAGQNVSAAYVEAEVQALDDAVKLLSQTVAALLTDLHVNTSGNGILSA